MPHMENMEGGYEGESIYVRDDAFEGEELGEVQWRSSGRSGYSAGVVSSYKLTNVCIVVWFD